MKLISSPDRERSRFCWAGVSLGGIIGFSVNLTVPVVLALIFFSLSCGDKTDRAGSDGVSDDNFDAIDQSDGDPTWH